MAYINKEDLLGTINEVYERKYARCNWKTLYDLYRMCIKRINRAPEADVVEVVRCKDCKYHRDLDGGVKCDRMDGLLMTLPNDYCSYGRRKERWL